MGYALLKFGPWLAAIFMIGAAMAFFVRNFTSNERASPWLVWSSFAFALGIVLTLLGAVPGRGGVWLETGVAAFAFYMAGAGAVALARRGNFSEHDSWALGLLPAALLWIGANSVMTPRIEADLAKSVREALASGDEKNAQVVVDGRDVTISGLGTNNSKLLDVATRVEGVRLLRADGKTVADTLGTTVPESAADRGSDAARNAEDARNEAEAAARRAAEQAKLAAARATMATASIAERTRAARETLRSLPSSAPLDGGQCQAALDATLTLSKIQFHSGGWRIHSASIDVLERLATLLRRCPDKMAEVAGHTDNVGKDEDNVALSQRRADAVVDFLSRAGVPKDRLASIGYGASKPIASNATDEGQAENRRIEIILK